MTTPKTLLRRTRKRWFYGLFIAFLLANAAYLLTQPRWLFTAAARIRPGALYAVNLPPKTTPVVALTIDDGPSESTADILAVLKRYDAKATFFNISDHLSGHEATVLEAVAAGHELGNHLTADEPSIRLSPDDFESAITTAEEVWQPYLLDNSLRWLRPGMGFYSTEMVSIAEQRSYSVVLGSVFPYDTHVPFSGFAIAFILHTVQPGDIIVLHDGEGRGERTVATLEKVLPALQAEGYKVTTLTELAEGAEAEMLLSE